MAQCVIDLPIHGRTVWCFAAPRCVKYRLKWIPLIFIRDLPNSASDCLLGWLCPLHLGTMLTNSVALVMSIFLVVLIWFMSCRWTYQPLWPPSQSAVAPPGITHPPQHLFAAKASLGYVEQTGWVPARWAAAGLAHRHATAEEVNVLTGKQHNIRCISSAAGCLFYKTTARNIYYHNPLILDNHLTFTR